jgi:predicted ester cyclase
LFKAYPDIRFEVISRGDNGEGLVAVQLILHGTNTGPLIDGSPPTGRTVSFPLASFAQIKGDKIHSEYIYLDQQTIAEQLGLTPKKT